MESGFGKKHVSLPNGRFVVPLKTLTGALGAAVCCEVSKFFFKHLA